MLINALSQHSTIHQLDMDGRTLAVAASLGVLVGVCISSAVTAALQNAVRTPEKDRWDLRTIGIVRYEWPSSTVSSLTHVSCRSCYRLCVGTPRQGMLAPHARGRIELSVAEDALDGVADFGYVWIVFGFHLNTVGAKTRTKIAAPARGTTGRVGVLATRSPHRFNSIGITLAKLEGVEMVQRKNDRGRIKRIPCIHISGHDLVDGTPVFDVKVNA